MANSKEIQIFNRYTNKVEIEKVYGDKFVKFLYDSFSGKLVAPFVVNKIVSSIYGATQNTNSSSKKIPQFIKDFDIKIDDYQAGTVKSGTKETSYKTFNEFFIRKFAKDIRTFNESPDNMSAFSEARYFGYEQVSNDKKYPVKGDFISARSLLNNEKWSEQFEGGPFLIARLCPVDYHRYHYPLDGSTIDSYTVSGDYHSVNPLALKYRQDILCKNERRVSILQTEKFGKLAYIEVGAIMVGKIVQTYNEKESFCRGDEKGYFLFGGSTVIVLGEKGAWKPSQDIIDNTEKGIETYIHLGDVLATK